VPSWGGQYQSADLGGPRDRRDVERRPDVLVYSTDPFETDIEVTGPIAVELWASTDAKDTDWTAALVDVFPDGRAIILCEGICRARYRDEMAAPLLIAPNTPTPFRIDLWSTSNAFLAGHRIRLEISSSNFPRFDRNLNTGGRVGFETESTMATAAESGHFGLAGMRERAESIGGTLTVLSHPGQGAVVTATLPFLFAEDPVRGMQEPTPVVEDVESPAERSGLISKLFGR